jgi:hypothetical protein
MQNLNALGRAVKTVVGGRIYAVTIRGTRIFIGASQYGIAEIGGVTMVVKRIGINKFKIIGPFNP